MERSNSTKTSSSGNSNLQHVCSVCNRLLTSPYKLREHMMIHTGEKPHACKVCKQAFRTKPDLARHMRIHTGERPYSCKLCNQRFHRSDNLRGHMRVHKDKDTLRCDSCGDLFADVTQLNRHRLTKHAIPIVIEPEKTVEPKKIKGSQLKASTSETVPEMVKEEIDASGYLDDSDGDHRGPHHFVCSECNSTFYQKGALAMHVKLVHGKTGSRASSPAISISSSSPSPAPDGDKLSVSEPSSTVYLCGTCGQSFADLDTLTKHTATVHEKSQSKDSSESFGVVDENMNYNEDEEGWTIEVDSDAEFTDGEVLDSERNGDAMEGEADKEEEGQDLSQRTMNGAVRKDKLFSCEDCDEKFAEKHELNRHTIMGHSLKVPYRCTACGKGFLRQDRLIAHIRVHTGKSPHTCEHCHKSFTASSSLKEHMKIHTGEKPHHCHVCGKNFRQKCVLTRHIRNVHKTGTDLGMLPSAEPTSNEANDQENDLPLSLTPVDDDTQDEAMDFSMGKSGDLLLSEPVSDIQKHLDSNTPAKIFFVNNPMLLESINSSAKQPAAPTAEGALTHSCAACNTKFSSIEALSTHLMTHHVIKLQGSDPVQQSHSVSHNPYHSDIPNVVIKQDGGGTSRDHEVIVIGDEPTEIINDMTPTRKTLLVSDQRKMPANGYISTKLSKKMNLGVSDSDESLPTGSGSEETLSRCPLKCSLCGLIFSSQQQLNKHTDNHVKSDPFFCSLCSATFRNTSVLEEHIKTHVDLIENIQNLKDTELVDSESNITCTVCREQLEEESELAEHMKMHCPGNDSASFSCTLCDRSFEKAELMNAHFSQHHCPSPGSDCDLRLYGCNFCFRPFAKVRTLVLHLKTHLVDKPFLCEMCGKAFSHSAYLKQHVRTHTGERPYTCSACGRSFSQKTQLTLHERQHRGETPYQCETCGKAFTNKSVLKLHRTTHLSLPPFRCKICDRRFTQAGNVRRHIGMVHKDYDMSDDQLYICESGLPNTAESTKSDTEMPCQEDVAEGQPLDLSRQINDGVVVKCKNSTKDTSETKDNASLDKAMTVDAATKSDDDDLLVMGAYYQQQTLSNPNDQQGEGEDSVDQPQNQPEECQTEDSANEANSEKNSETEDVDKVDIPSGRKRKMATEQVSSPRGEIVDLEKELEEEEAPKRKRRKGNLIEMKEEEGEDSEEGLHGEAADSEEASMEVEQSADDNEQPEASSPHGNPDNESSTCNEGCDGSLSTMKESLVKESPAKESVAKESAAKESAAKESAAKESAAKESAAKESAAKESAAKESAAKESAAKESAAKESESLAKESTLKECPAKESPAKESPAKETSPKKSSAKESSTKQATK